jgi:hypothetical protein
MCVIKDFANAEPDPDCHEGSERPDPPDMPDPPLSPSPGPPEPPQGDPESTATPDPAQDLSGDVEDLWDPSLIHLDDLKHSTEFIQILRTASLDNPIGRLSEEALH